MGIELRDTVMTRRRRKRQQVNGVEGAQTTEIEDGTQVDEEWIVPLASEDRHAIRQRVDRLRGKRIVVRSGTRADVVGGGSSSGP